MNNVQPTSLTEAFTLPTWAMPVIIGALIGLIVTSIVLILQHRKQHPGRLSLLDAAWVRAANNMAADQLAMDTFGLQALVEWIRADMPIRGGNARYIVMRPVEKHLAALNWRSQEQPDPEHSLLVFVVSGDQHELLRTQLFTFTQLQEDLSKLLNDHDDLLQIEN